MADRNEVVRLAAVPSSSRSARRSAARSARFRHRGRDLMRPAGPAFFASADPREASSFPLVPFSNRIADGRFGFRGAQLPAAPELPARAARDPRRWLAARLEFAKRARAGRCWTSPIAIEGTPLDYRARQTFALDEDGLEVDDRDRQCRRRPDARGARPAPLFQPQRRGHAASAPRPRLAGRRAQAPSGRRRCRPEWDFARGAATRSRSRSTTASAAGTAAAQIHWPEAALTLAIAAEPLFGHLVVYVPPGRDFFCVEPVSHVNDGFNLARARRGRHRGAGPGTRRAARRHGALRRDLMGERRMLLA